MSHIQRKTVLITGASTGIGYELAKLFAKDAYDLILVARGAEGLIKVADELTKEYSSTVVTIAQDLSQPGAATNVFKQLEDKNLTIDVLVNNAGFGTYGEFTEVPLADQLGMMQVNMVSLVELTYLVLRGMRKRKQGKILNVASTAAFQPGPFMAIYFASKAFLLSFSEALSTEVLADLIVVTALCPGPTKTQFTTRAHLENSKMFKGNLMGANRVASEGYKALKEGKLLVIPGRLNQLGAFVTRLVSRKFVVWLLYRNQG